MRITIRSPHVSASDTVRTYIGRRLRESLVHFEDRIGSVQVRLEDVNGPRGGLDKLCQVVIGCGKLGTVHTEAKHKTLRDAIDGAIERAKHAVTHAVDRKQTVRRSKVPHRRAER